MNGWRRLNPAFRIIEWNEDNFDLDACEYASQAYQAKKYAFVADYARGLAMLSMGGVYLDTDVELIAPLEPLLSHEGFIGFEYGNSIATSTFGFRPGHPLMERYLRHYGGRKFISAEGVMDQTTNVRLMTKLAQDIGMIPDGSFQQLGEGVVCLPMAILSPLDYVNHVDHRTRGTVAIHHYSHTWGGLRDKCKKFLSRFAAAIFGKSLTALIRSKIGRARRGG